MRSNGVKEKQAKNLRKMVGLARYELTIPWSPGAGTEVERFTGYQLQSFVAPDHFQPLNRHIIR